MPLDNGHAASVATDVQVRAAQIRQRVNDRLAELIPSDDEEPQQLHRAMRYSLLGSGKRIRPIMTVMVATHLGGSEELALEPACAIEMVHAASLILDDLPSMDDATLRRGQHANHIVFGEHIALLAAMALLNGSYAVAGSAPGLTPEVRLQLVNTLSSAVGCDGLIGGQMLDLENWHGRDLGSLQQTNLRKTAALFVAAAENGARIAGVPEHEVTAVRCFARDLGLSFQLFDDLLDVSHSEAEAGKNVYQDEGKSTLVSLMGADDARALAKKLLESAVTSLAPLGSSGASLAELAQLLLPGGAEILKNEP